MAIKVALAGATGNLGPVILKELLDAGFEVTVLTRTDSQSADSIPSHPNQKIVKVDYDSVDGLTSALRGNEVFVSTITAHAFSSQKTAIDAAVAAGIKRIIPSEFGCDLDDPLNKAVPVFHTKIQTREYIESIVKTNPDFTYTYVVNNAFFDWGLKVGFVGLLKAHKISYFDGGDHPVSFTTLLTIGKAVAGVIKNQEATKNRTVRIHDVAMSQRQLVDFVKKIDGKEWTIDEKDTKEGYAAALEELKKPEPNMMMAVSNQLHRCAFSKDHPADFSGRTDNKLLGLAENDMGYIEKVVRELL